MTKPAIGVQPLPGHIVNGIVMNDSFLTYFFAINDFFKTVMDHIIGNFKMGSAGQADGFMRGFPLKRNKFGFQFFIVGSGYFTIKDFAGIRIPDRNA